MLEVFGDQPDYILTRRNFLDAVWNRFAVIRFEAISGFKGSVYKLPRYKDRFGRVKMYLLINSNYPTEEQGETLVHEVIHIDRQSWAKYQPSPLFSDDIDCGRMYEEQITEEATTIFYAEHKPLALKALHHLWLRRAQEENK